MRDILAPRGADVTGHIRLHYRIADYPRQPPHPPRSGEMGAVLLALLTDDSDGASTCAIATAKTLSRARSHRSDGAIAHLGCGRDVVDATGMSDPDVTVSA